MVEKSGVEKFLFALGLKSSWLKSPGLKGLGLKLGVEKSGVEMSFNRPSLTLEYDSHHMLCSRLHLFQIVQCPILFHPDLSTC